ESLQRRSGSESYMEVGRSAASTPPLCCRVASTPWRVRTSSFRIDFEALQELVVRLDIVELRHQEIHRFDEVHPLQHPPEDVDVLQPLARHDLLLLARAGLLDVHRREDPAVGELAGEHELHVAGALE